MQLTLGLLVLLLVLFRSGLLASYLARNAHCWSALRKCWNTNVTRPRVTNCPNGTIKVVLCILKGQADIPLSVLDGMLHLSSPHGWPWKSWSVKDSNCPKRLMWKKFKTSKLHSIAKNPMLSPFCNASEFFSSISHVGELFCSCLACPGWLGQRHIRSCSKQHIYMNQSHQSDNSIIWMPTN